MEREDVRIAGIQREVEGIGDISRGLSTTRSRGDEDLIEIFSEEARSWWSRWSNRFRSGAANPGIRTVQRSSAHAPYLKGGARLSGVMAMGDLSHAFETLLSEVDPQQTGIWQMS